MVSMNSMKVSRLYVQLCGGLPEFLLELILFSLDVFFFFFLRNIIGTVVTT